jgi:hypothetical protein
MLGESDGIGRMDSKRRNTERGNSVRFDRKLVGDGARGSEAPTDRNDAAPRGARPGAGAVGARSRVTWQGFVDWMTARNA